MNEIIVRKKIEDMIYEIRGVQVILDSDLAILYGVETKRINEAVRRNLEKFPDRFSWLLSDNEYINLRSQIATSSWNDNYGGRRYNPRAFTEQGIAMLATILKSPLATKISINIIDAFVAMRKYIANGNYEKRIFSMPRFSTKLIEHDNKLDEVFSKLDNTVNNHIFFEGQIYDAYSLLVDILNKSKESIIIIDNYIDKKLLDVISKVKRQVKVITTHKSYIDVEKYLEQYNNLEIVINNSFHDRFILIDNKELYHCGASFKDLGKKCFAITKMDDERTLEGLMARVAK